MTCMMNHTVNIPRLVLILLLHFLTTFGCFLSPSGGDSTEKMITLVGDMNSPFSRMMRICMDMAISDFYSAYSHYKTMLQLSTKDAKTTLDFNLAVLESARRGEIVGILQPQGSSSEEALAAAVGESLHLPIISFTARSSALPNSKSSYLVRTTLDDAVQAQAFASICHKLEWTQVVILYEDTGDSDHFLTHTIKAFQDIHIRLARMNSVPTSAEDGDILKELYELKMEQTKVFVVHMTPALGHRLFEIAEKEGMMSEGYIWIITDSLSIFMNSINFNPDGSMDGVLGIRPYAYPSNNLESFRKSWKRKISTDKMSTSIMELNIYGLWAYDAITALAVAIEETGPVNSGSSYGPRLLSKLLSTKFRGLTGNFELVAGKLKPAAYEIFNIIGTGERRVGFWTPERRIARVLNESGASTSELKKITWPGDSLITPKGWRIPATGNLRVGIPCMPGFKEFVNEAFDPARNQTNATGFAVDIFFAALKVLPFPVNYEFRCYRVNFSRNRTYDAMLQRIPQEFDMVVGDITIWASRTAYVDFSQSYTESGIVLVVKNRKPVDMWIFIKPLRWDLWLAIIIACIFMGGSLHILEHRSTITDQGSVRPRSNRPGLMFWSPITFLAFPERNMILNKWSVFTLVCWLFMAFILMQSFTANLSAILTIDQLKFAFSEDYYVGYREGTYMRYFLMEQLHIRESRLRAYASIEQFHEAMVKGSKNGGVDAIFSGLPFMKLLLIRHENHYKIVGPTYRTNGLGFAFPKGSPLTVHFSTAILKVTQGPEMKYLELKNFGPGYSSQDPMSSVISQGTSSLTLREFGGLFLTVGSLTLLALLCSETSIGQRIQNGFGSRIVQANSTMDITSVEGDVPHGGGDGSSELDNAREGDEIYETAVNNEAVVVDLDDALTFEKART